MIAKKITKKAYNRLWWFFMNGIRRYRVYPCIYGAWWHALFHRGAAVSSMGMHYMTAVPNPGAGIGHQIANWNAGYWFAKKFGCKYAHSKFSSPRWEEFLNFGEGEVLATKLISEKKYTLVRLPWFDEYCPKELMRTQKIIDSYSSENVLFCLEQDQGYKDQFGVCDEIKQKFRKRHKKTDGDAGNILRIAIHIRRGDIIQGQTNGNENLSMRWQGLGYFEAVIRDVVECVPKGCDYEVLLFSQGDISEYDCFMKYGKVIFCLDMNVQESFLQMADADVLITSKSSFSYKPALLSDGIKICPKNFWHGYPDNPLWVLADDHGTLDKKQLRKIISKEWDDGKSI